MIGVLFPATAFGEPIANPCVRKFGRGPAGATCRGCARLITKEFHNRTYYKCELRGDTNGKATDHRVSWPACAKYVAGKGGVRVVDW